MSKILEIKQATEDFLLNIPGVAGVGIARSSPEKIRVYVEEAVPEVLAKIPRTIGGLEVEIIESGEFVILDSVVASIADPVYQPLAARTDKWRPSPGGVSLGCPRITAGTLGTRVFDAVTGEKLILSNNHVIAASDSIQNERAREGDAVLQPGAHDRGTDPADRLATLHRWVKIDEVGDNIVDCALGLPLDPADIADEVLEIGPVTEMVEAEEGMRVKKSGRCFTKDTLILTNPDGPKTVSELEVGDRVYSYNGEIEKREVKNIFYQGIRDVYRVSTRNRAVNVTLNHPFLVAVKNKGKRTSTYELRRTKKKVTRTHTSNEWELQWRKVKDIKKGDLIVTLHHIDDSFESIGTDLARFLGFFLGDGFANYKRGNGGRIVLYCPSRNEALFYANLIKKLFKKKFKKVVCTRCGRKSNSRAKICWTCGECGNHKAEVIGEFYQEPKISRRKNTWLVSFYSSDIAKKFMTLFPAKKLNKRIPDMIWGLPRDEKVAFIEGYCDADGHRYRHYSSGCSRVYSFGSPNERLIKELRELCILSGIRVTNVYSREHGGFKKSSTVWEFKCYPDAKKKKNTHTINSGIERLDLPKELQLESVTTIEYIGKKETYDIEVEGTHNFIGNGVLMHNTTGLTTGGTIVDVNATIRVGFRAFVAVFRDQIITTPGVPAFAAPGDSGSLLCDNVNRAVGLLFAGSRWMIAHNKITNVARELGISFAPIAPPVPPVPVLPMIVGMAGVAGLGGWLIGGD